MQIISDNTDCRLAEDDPLHTLLEGTATVVGERFFEALVENLARAMETRYAWVTEYLVDRRLLRALAFWVDGELVPDFEVPIDDTPCEAVIDKAQLVHYPNNIRSLFPRSAKLAELGAVSYMGVPLMDVNHTILGHLAVIDDRPMPREPRRMALFRLFAGRAAAEMQRLRAEAEVRQGEERLARLVASAMDAIVELDRRMAIVLLNPAAETLLAVQAPEASGQTFARFLSPASRQGLARLIDDLTGRPVGKQSLWVPGGLEVVSADGRAIAAEATLSLFEIQQRPYYTLILRNINERLEADRQIQSLREEAAYLEQEIRALDNFEEIVGRSRPLREVLRSADLVARTDSTVLILGETGTGKELVARAIHRRGPRADRPFIKLNCAALPDQLVESELFGHEPGAFTGADRRRRGRFELADGGTIFLDEISELPLQVQAKLLRVLQEGRFERVGGNKTLSSDVRVIAASNRKLHEDVIESRFRADLFYRLNVFPITVPPLRDRREDIPLLADYFVARLSARLGKSIDRIPAATMTQLTAYDWPGNVRELKNVVERAIITSSGADLVLPEMLGRSPSAAEDTARDGKGDLATLAEIERRHITRVLQATGWRISGPRGAAGILAMKPSTLRYRMQKLGIRIPRPESSRQNRRS